MVFETVLEDIVFVMLAVIGEDIWFFFYFCSSVEVRVGFNYGFFIGYRGISREEYGFDVRDAFAFCGFFFGVFRFFIGVWSLKRGGEMGNFFSYVCF